MALINQEAVEKRKPEADVSLYTGAVETFD